MQPRGPRTLSNSCKQCLHPPTSRRLSSYNLLEITANSTLLWLRSTAAAIKQVANHWTACIRSRVRLLPVFRTAEVMWLVATSAVHTRTNLYISIGWLGNRIDILTPWSASFPKDNTVIYSWMFTSSNTMCSSLISLLNSSAGHVSFTAVTKMMTFALVSSPADDYFPPSTWFSWFTKTKHHWVEMLKDDFAPNSFPELQRHWCSTFCAVCSTKRLWMLAMTSNVYALWQSLGRADLRSALSPSYF